MLFSFLLVVDAHDETGNVVAFGAYVVVLVLVVAGVLVLVLFFLACYDCGVVDD